MTAGSHILIQDAVGALINAKEGRLASTTVGDDSCLWRREDNHLVHAHGTRRLTLEPLDAHKYRLVLENGDAVEGAPFLLLEGPRQTPSWHLKDLQENGFTIVPHIMNDHAIARLKAQISEVRSERHADESSHDGYFWIVDSLMWSAEVARAASHPVALWIMQRYMRTEEMHFCHQPVITTVKPADALRGTFPERGWHTDYPYHRGVFPDDSWPEQPVFGVQFNVCVDAFRPDNAATQYLPGSHLRRKNPPLEFNTPGTRMGHGQHAEVRQWLAPAGSGLIYDSRMWHRACHELNTSGRDRLAILNAVAPAYVRPMLNKSALGRAFPGSPVARGLTEREREDMARLCCTPTRPTPPGMPQLNRRRSAPRFRRQTAV